VPSDITTAFAALSAATLLLPMAHAHAARPAAAQAAVSRPNILLIIADDLGWADLHTGSTSGGNGSKYHQTPHLDRLAAQGVSFTSAYAYQNCQPTRAALMTGQYAPRNGVYNVASLARKVTGPLALTPPEQRTRIRPEAVTIAETLKAAGYVTAHVGKFHVSGSPEQITTEHGFAFNYGGGAPGDGGPGGYFALPGAAGRGWHFRTMGREMDAFAAPYTRDYIAQSLKPWAKSSDPATLEGTPKHLTDAHADAALDFLRKHRSGADRDKPFFLNVAFNAVHVAVRPRPDLAAKYAGLKSADLRQTNAAYAALTEGMDQAVGRILDSLEDPDGNGDRSDSIARNTLVVFVSDNGGFGGSTSNAPLRGSKGMFSEGGLRVPLIVRLPGGARAGTTSAAPVHVIDLYPTFAALGRAALPDSNRHTLDGVSLDGVLRGKEKTPTGRDTLYWHFPGYLDTRAVPCSSVVKDRHAAEGGGGKRYKLMYFYEDRHYELYCLSDDPGEDKNLLAGKDAPTGAIRGVAEDLRTDLSGWLARIAPSYPTDPATGKAVPSPVPFGEARWGGPRFEAGTPGSGAEEGEGESDGGARRGGKGTRGKRRASGAQEKAGA
jgi:arylsulfatase A-like enzyme